MAWGRNHLTPPPFLCAHDITELVATPTISWDLVPLSCTTDLTFVPLWRVSMKSPPFGLKGVHSSEGTAMKISCSGPCRLGYAPLFASSWASNGKIELLEVGRKVQESRFEISCVIARGFRWGN